MTKTCGECKHLNRELAFCRKCGAKWMSENDGANCKYFEKQTPPTNGDRIRQMNNEELAEIISNVDCKICPACMTCFEEENETCFDGMLAWLNAPAESEETK